MSPQTESAPKPQKAAAALADVRIRGLEVMSALSELNQRVMGGLIELSSSAALEGVRALAELQSAAVEAARPAARPKPADTADEDAAPESSDWSRRGFESAVSAAQRIVKLLEKNGEILARSAEHTQTSAERTAKEVREAIDVYAERIRKIYSRN